MTRKLYVFLEGNDDERFFLHVLFPLLKKKHPEIQIIPYAEESAKITRKFVSTIRLSSDDYIFVKDIDDAPCVTAKKTSVACKYQVEQRKLMIVVNEIECWYLCGLNYDCCKKLGVQAKFGRTDGNFTKEDFNNLIPNGVTRIEFMRQLLNEYDIKIGIQRNRSLRYFLRKWVSNVPVS